LAVFVAFAGIFDIPFGCYVLDTFSLERHVLSDSQILRRLYLSSLDSTGPTGVSFCSGKTQSMSAIGMNGRLTDPLEFELVHVVPSKDLR
jgi:hypothetical protein